MTSRLFARFFKVTVFIMALTGMAQMPIAKRYYIADLPGLGWLADFYLTNKIHYAFGAILLGMAFYLAAVFIMRVGTKARMTSSGVLRSALYLLVMITGVLRVIKNLHSVTLSPYSVMMIDWTHLGFAILLGLVAMYAFFRGRIPYLKEKAIAAEYSLNRRE